MFLSACGGGSSGDVAEDDVAENKVQLGVYLADQLVDQHFELFRFDTSGAGAVGLSGALQVAGDVRGNLKVSPDGRRVAYRADQDIDNVAELCSATPDGAANDKLNGALATGGNVADFAWSPMRL